MQVYCVFADHTYEKELLYIFREKAAAREAQAVEQENFDTSGTYSDVIIETWEVE